jgi:hypothetical protein
MLGRTDVKIFADVWKERSCMFKDCECLALKMKALRPFEKSVSSPVDAV